MDDMSYQVNKRKACDLCFHKKIKCDMLVPVCSNCQLYKAQCRVTKHRRKYERGKSSVNEPAAGDSSNFFVNLEEIKLGQHRLESMEKRLGYVEQQLVQTVDTSLEDSQQTRAAFVSRPHQELGLLDQYNRELDDVLLDETNNENMSHHYIGPAQSAHEFTPGASNTSATDLDLHLGVAETSELHLPPLAEIQPMIDYFFAQINPLIPLFSQSRFSVILHDYYTSICQSPTITWAAVNIILGLATCFPALPSSDLDIYHSNTQAVRYIKNVQKVLPELLMHDGNLLVLQVVLGLVMISQTMRDSHPAVILAGMAVRLAQRLRLHCRNSQPQLSLEEKLEREHVFWITYLYDKDICLRHHTPSAQDDTDVDVDLPTENSVDGAGNVYSVDALVRFNFFRHRLHLAHIQGRVYDLLFSNKSGHITSQERALRVTVLHKELEQWRLSIPREFQAESVRDNVNRVALIWICMMHFSYLSCLVMIHGIWSHDAEWRKRLTVRPLDMSFTGQVLDRSKFRPPLPPGWRNCVQMSRSCMSLISQMPLSDCSVWANGCAYFSALLILQTNIIENPLDTCVDSDLHLTGVAVTVLDKMSEVSSIMAMKRMNIVAAELDRQARFVVSGAQRIVLAGNSNALVDDLMTARVDQRIPLQIPLEYSNTIKWDWGKEGVEAWPEMDFFIYM